MNFQLRKLELEFPIKKPCIWQELDQEYLTLVYNFELLVK